jgi:DUF1680 family protein
LRKEKRLGWKLGGVEAPWCCLTARRTKGLQEEWDVFVGAGFFSAMMPGMSRGFFKTCLALGFLCLPSEPALARAPLDLARLQVSGDLHDRLVLARDYLLANEPRLTTDQGWGADQIARWLETMTLLSHQDGEDSAAVAAVMERFLALQKDDGRLYLDGDGQELWGASRSLVFLTTYYEDIKQDPKVLDAAVRLGDQVAARLQVPARPDSIVREGSFLATIRGFAALARWTGAPRFLDEARTLARAIDPQVAPPGPHPLVHVVVDGKTMHIPDVSRALAAHQHHSHSYLEAVRGLVELYRAGGDPVALRTARSVWEATLAHTMWVSGGIPEVYGEPFEHNDETCSVVSWLCLTLALYEVTGEARYADVAEHVFLNHLAFDEEQRGGFCGDRSLSRSFQVTPANRGVVADECCTMSGPRGLLEALRYAVTSNAKGIDVGLFLPLLARVPVGSDEVRIEMATDYPATGRVEIRVDPAAGGLGLELRLRMPEWLLEEPKVFVNDRRWAGTSRYGWYSIQRRWQPGDRVRYEMTLPVEIVGTGGNGFNQPRIVAWSRTQNVFKDAALFEGPRLLIIDRGRSGRFPETWRLDVATNANGRLELAHRDAGGPRRAPFTLPGEHFRVQATTEDGVPGGWVTLFPLAEMTGQRLTEPDTYVARNTVAILP